MAPVALPTAHPRVTLPTQPEDPPSDADIIFGKRYTQKVWVAFEANNVEERQAADAEVYMASLIAAKAGDGVALPWFNTAINGLQDELKGLRNEATVLTNEMKEMKEAMTGLRKELRGICRYTSLAYNRQAADGEDVNFAPVPFKDGSMPHDHNLPPLQNAGDIRALPVDDRNQYYSKYIGKRVPRAISDDDILASVMRSIGALQ